MTEVYPSLFVGSQTDCEELLSRPAAELQQWSIVHACKEPHHRLALGYTGRGAPKDHPEYLIAKRPGRLILNLVDVPDPVYIRKEIIDAALAYIESELLAGQKVLVHCNRGNSRAPVIALLYIASKGGGFEVLDATEAWFRNRYPSYAPGDGMAGFLRANYNNYRKEATCSN